MSKRFLQLASRTVRDLVLILPILNFLSNACRKAIDHRPIAGSAKSR